ncbi:MAG: alpha/beta fold hydrolase, partial [Mesorhizobium sp.]
MASFGLKVIRGVFGAAEHVAPRLSGRAAFELFCRTPNVKALSDGERRAVERAAAFMAEARHHRLKTKKGCVMVHEFRPEPGRAPAGTVLVIHGWRSRTEYMRALIEGYRGAGYKVVSLDLPGHGQSQGRRLNMVTAVEAARVAGEWFGPFKVIVGHSFGGAVAANAVAGSVRGIQPI